MSDNKQHQHNDQLTEHGNESTPGILITRVRGYNLFNTVFFTGRRHHLDVTLTTVGKTAPGENVLDIGCGPGRFAGVLADRVGPSGTVVGVDPSGPMIEYASTHAGRRSNCEFHRGAAQSLNFPDATFDVVTATFVMHHIFEEQREVALANMFRVLRPGGRLLLADAHPLERVRTGAVRLLARSAARHHGRSAATDPFAAVDVRNYIGTLRAIGFDDVEFRAVKPSTGTLLAVKPA